MTLARFFDEVAPVLLGETPAAQAAPALYGAETGREIDRARLSIYARFCRNHRFEVIEGLFPHCRASVERARGRTAWAALVESYFRQHPMRDVELNANGASWPAFLAENPAGLPPWLPPLADFEWWEWQTIIAPDPSPTETIRIHPTVELRPYDRDFVCWIADDLEGEPEAAPTVVLFWRDRTLALRRENAKPIELLILKSVAEGFELTPAVLKQTGFTRRAVTAAQRKLREAGILEGG